MDYDHFLLYICICMDNINEISRIISDLRKDEPLKRQRTSLYLAEDLYKEFRMVCGEVPPSKVIERIMRVIVEQSKQTA